MKNKRIILGISLLTCGLVAAIVPSAVSTLKAGTGGTPRDLTSSIRASKPGVGETVSFLPDAPTKFYQMDNLLNTYVDKASEIGELMPYNDEMASFASHLSGSDEDKAYVRNLYKKYDAFRPTNNTLSWTSDLDAKSYKVIVSQDKDLSYIEREYTVDGDENSVLLENPYSSTTYYWQVIATLEDESKLYSDVFSFETANLPRTINLPGISNTRDLGGSVGLNNKRMKEGLVYRGARLEDVTDEAISEAKSQLGFKTEVDLRAAGEGKTNVLGLANYYNYSSPFECIDGYSSHVSCIDYFGTGSLVPNFGEAVKVFANKDNYPIYFHCTVGRDRTGFMGFVLNLLCGVNAETALKEYLLSHFSVTGGAAKGTISFYTRLKAMLKHFDTYEGENYSEKVENYLVTNTSVTNTDCENIRKILLGDIDVGFKPGKVNPDPITDLCKVTFRKFGETSVMKLVEKGSKLSDPGTVGTGAWYHGEELWDFDNDVVNEDMYLDYITPTKLKVSVRYSGIVKPDDVFEFDVGEEFDFSIFERSGYTYKVYDESFNQIQSLIVTEDVAINVVYKSTSGFKPKANSRIIVMAGQSNGAGVAHYDYLPKTVDEAKVKEINDGYENVLLTGYSHGKYLDEFKKVYADKYYETAGTPGTYGFEIGLADRLSKAFPDETTYIVKVAYGGVSLNYDFLSPSSMDYELETNLANELGERGWMYNILEDEVNEAINYIAAKDNSIPMIEGFMWMQGESDAVYEISTNLYLNSFNNLLDDFKTTFKDNISYKFKVYDAGIFEPSGIWERGDQINDMKKSRADENNIYISTNERLTTLFEPIGTATDTAHYDAGCYIDLGHMFADAYLEQVVKGYTHNSIEIEAPSKITMKMGENYVMSGVKALFNGVEVPAKIAYFARQHKLASVIWYFEVNEDGSFTPTRLGESELKITAYYHDEIRMIIIPVEIVE